MLGRGPRGFFQRHRAAVARQTIKVSPIETGEGLELVQGIGGLEGLGIELQRGMRGVTAGAAGGVLLQMRRVRRAVGAQEKAGVPIGCGLHQGLAVGFALQDRQAVVRRPDAAREDGIAVVQQVVRRDGGTQQLIALAHVLRGLARGDVLEHDLQAREIAAQGDEVAVNEDGLAVKEVDVGTGHLAMYQQQHAHFLHGFEHRVDLAQLGHARIAVGGGAGRIELGRHHTCGLGPLDFLGRQVIGEVERHQGLKTHAGRHGGAYAVAVGQGLGSSGHRRLEVGHDDRAAELARRVRHHGGQHIAIAHMQVPIVGTGEGELGSHRAIVPNADRAGQRASLPSPMGAT